MKEIVYSKFNGGKFGYKNYKDIDLTKLKKYIKLNYIRQRIAKKLNISVDKLRRDMIKFNLVLLSKSKRISKEDFEYLYYKTNLSYKDICKKLDIGICLYFQLRKKFNCDKKGKIYFELNKEKILKERKDKRKKWDKENKNDQWKKNRKYYKNKYYTDSQYQWKEYLRLSIRERIKQGNGTKKLKTEELLGCTINEARQHLEKQFKQGMTWETYGIKGWHIDHIQPISSFDLSKKKNQEKCFHYTNLQPLWWYENLAKRDKLVEI